MCFISSRQLRDTDKILFDLKTNLQVLEKALSVVKERYGADMCQFLRLTLRRGYDQRPSATELLQLPFIQHCLQLMGSTLCKEPLEGGCGQGVEVKKVGVARG